jgi:uncharacterized protein (DUF1697 family)
VSTYIALLRAINLAGKNRVDMAGLRELCAGLGLEDARTLLQSGNLVFTAKGASASLERALEAEVKKRIGLDTDVFVRTAKEWEAIMAGNPYPGQAERDPGHLVVVFLKDAPGRSRAAALADAIPGREVARVDGRHAYIHYPDGIGRSKLTMALIEKKLGTRGTGRNWNTVRKLGAMLPTGPRP